MAFRIHVTAEAETLDEAFTRLFEIVGLVQADTDLYQRSVPQDGTTIAATLGTKDIGCLSVENDQVMTKMPLRRVGGRMLRVVGQEQNG